MSIAPVCELGGSVFNTASALQGLIAAGSVDDVQPQAIKVAEALGHLFWASSRRIGEGIDALGGNNSVRLERFKASIGLHSGDVPRIMRESTALTKFFLMVTSLKMCHDEQEIGDIVFEMFDQSSLSGKLAVSPAQMGRLVSVISGHCNSILPFGLQDQVVNCITEHLVSGRLYRAVEPRMLARLLVSIFEQLHDGSISSVHVSGHVHCGWLAPTLLWLLDEDACMVIHGDLVLGSPTSKVTIVVDPLADNFSWIVKTFKEDQEVTSNVHTFDDDHEPTLKRIPIGMTRQLFSERLTQRRVQEAPALQACRIMIEVLTELLLRHARIVQGTQGDENGIRSTGSAIFVVNEVSLAALLCKEAQQPLSSIAESYGWPLQDQDQRLAVSKATASILEGYGVRHLPGSAPSFDDMVQGCDNMTGPERMMPIAVIRDICSVAVNICLDAILSRLVEHADSGAQERSASHKRFVSSTLLEKFNDYVFFDKLIQSTITPQLLLDEALKHLLPGFLPARNDLIVSYGGVVVGLACIWEPQLSPHASLRLKMVSGDIRRDGMSYDRITELEYMRSIDAPSDCARQKWTEPIVIPPRHQHRLQCSVATSGRRIEVKHYLTVYSSSWNTEVKRHIAWKSAALTLATATTLDSRGSLLTQSPSLDPDKYILVQAPQTAFDISEEICIVPLWSSPVLMFTAASFYHTLIRRATPGHVLLVHRSGEIQSTVAHALTILNMVKWVVHVTILMV